MQVGEVAVPSWFHMLFFSFLLPAPVLSNVQVCGEATFSHATPSDFQINLRNIMRLIYFPNNFTIHSSTPSTFLGFIGSITNHYMLPERKCEFNTHTGRSISVSI
jgi:hypothetical protein